MLFHHIIVKIPFVSSPANVFVCGDLHPYQIFKRDNAPCENFQSLTNLYPIVDVFTWVHDSNRSSLVFKTYF